MRALILVDLQKDFAPGGVMAVPQGDLIVPLANQLQNRFTLVVATQEWHPASHSTFAMNHRGRSPGDVVTIKGRKQKLLRPHCVQHTEGAKLLPNLQLARVNRIFHLGADPEIDSYSAFFDNDHVRSTGLAQYLKLKKVKEVYVLGLATETCVKSTALDARALGFKTFLIADACRGLNLKPTDVPEVIEEMKKVGVKIVHSRNV
jgi:nicotinamidase/pyrazinamidase